MSNGKQSVLMNNNYNSVLYLAIGLDSADSPYQLTNRVHARSGSVA